jgi:hypothetical protein
VRKNVPFEKQPANGRSGRTLDLLQACRVTSVRTSENRPANRAFSLKPPPIGGPRVRNQSDRTQTNKATAATKKTCKCRPFSKRLKGFEPSTFCMASRTCVSWSACIFPANAGVLGCEQRPAIPRLLPGVHGGLGTQRAPSSYASGPCWSSSRTSSLTLRAMSSRIALTSSGGRPAGSQSPGLRQGACCGRATARLMSPDVKRKGLRNYDVCRHHGRVR